MAATAGLKAGAIGTPMRIATAQLNDGTTLEFSDFNVLIGGNAVGKTTLLLELYARATETNRNRWYWVTANGPTYATSDVTRDLKLLHGSMARHYEGLTYSFFSRGAKNLDGNADLDGRLRFTAGEYEELGKRVGGSVTTPSDIFATTLKYRRPFITFASCETRLNVPNSSGVNPYNAPPQDALNVLDRHRDLLAELDKRIAGQFGIRLCLLDHVRTQLELGLTTADPPQASSSVLDRQAEFDRIERWKIDNLVPVQEIGHGIRSMVKLLINLLDPVNQVVMIDEPEMHIYPAQKRWVGRELVRVATEQGKQVFVVTHDPMVLQGILDFPSASRVCRIEINDAGIRGVRQCQLQHVTDVGAKRNQDSYLQALFYRRCVAVEGAADRAFYQVMTEELLATDIDDADLGFVACGGKAPSRNMATLASRVGLRCAFLYDFDVLLYDVPMLKEIHAVRGGTNSALQKLEDYYKKEFDLDPKKIKAASGDAARIGLGSEFVKANLHLFEGVIGELEHAGVFVVPHGSLESWAPAVEPKVRFAELAPDVVKADAELRDSLVGFLKRIIAWLGC